MSYGVTWTTAELLEEVRDEAAIPSSSRFTNAKILAFADQAIRSIPSEVITTNLGFSGRNLDYDDVLLSSALRDGSELFVPEAAAGGSVSHIDYYQNNDRRPFRLLPCTAAEAEELTRPEGTGPGWWHFRDGRIVLVPAPALSANGSERVRVYFPRMHPKLVEAAAAGVFVGAVEDVSGDFTVTMEGTPPAAWPLEEIYLDLYSESSPHDVLVPRIFCAPAAGTPVGPNFEFPAGAFIDGNDDLTKIQSGARLALSGTSDCVQLPECMRKGVTARTASFIVRTIGDEARANAFWGVSKEEFQSVANTVEPRQKADKVVYVNRYSVLRRGRWRW